MVNNPFYATEHKYIYMLAEDINNVLYVQRYSKDVIYNNSPKRQRYELPDRYYNPANALPYKIKWIRMDNTETTNPPPNPIYVGGSEYFLNESGSLGICDILKLVPP
ncbi:MAG: hypothetical protein M1481_00180 [Candidatus Thermoplasmatota archaeon]|nr:hypothetical protein [Candidatus Thermoplasmatota archaeon]